MGWVYFVHAEGLALYKIGWTVRHPSHRLGDLQVGSPVPLRPIGVVGAEPTMETLLHAKFSSLRMLGEWFAAARPLSEWVEEHARPWPAVGERSPGEKPGLRAGLMKELRCRDEDGAIVFESLADRQKREWWEAEGFPGPVPLERIIWGACGWVMLRDGHAPADYWAFIERHRLLAIEAARFEAAGM